MDNRSDATESVRLDEMAEDALRLIATWRREVADQWGPGKLQLVRDELLTAIQRGTQLGLSGFEQLHVMLACEWTFRARKMTPEDVERELGEIRRGLSRSLGGALSEARAHLLVEAIAPGVRRQLRGRRILLSLNEWAGPLVASPGKQPVPSRGARPQSKVQPLVLVKTKAGAVANIGPAIAAVTLEGLAEQVAEAAHADGPPVASSAGERELYARSVAATLLKRKIPPPEFRGWRALLDRPQAGLSSPTAADAPARTLKEWLTRRLHQAHASFRSQFGWAQLRSFAVRKPGVPFQLLADEVVIARLYALTWRRKAKSKPARS